MTPKAFFKQFGGITLCVVFGVAFLTGLGSWQLKRLSWKETLIQTMQDRSSEPRLTLEDFLRTNSDFKEKEFRRLSLKGRYLHDQEVHLLGRTHEGQVVYHIVTPFLLESGTAVLVDRGWVPSKISSKDPSIERPTGTVEEKGFLKLKTSKNLFTPDNNYEKKELYYIDPTEFAQNKSLTTLVPFLVLREGGDGASYPRAQKIIIQGLKNNHLEYAITWYSLAFVLVIFYVLFLRQRRQLPPLSG